MVKSRNSIIDDWLEKHGCKKIEMGVKKELELLNEQYIKTEESLKHPVWKNHKRNESVYFMDNKADRWHIVYYPIFEDGKTQECYGEPRALVQNIDKGGFWSKEVPLRYLKS